MAGSLKKNFIYNSAYQVFQVITPLITTPYLSRVLGAAGVGDYSYTFAVAGYFVMFANLGMSNYGVRTIASAGDDREKRTRTFWSAYVSQLLISLLVLALYLAYGFIAPQGGQVLVLLWSLYVLSAAVNVSWLFFGVEDFGRTTAASFIVKILELVGIFALVRSKGDVWLYVALDSCAFLLNQVILWPFLRKYVGLARPTWKEIVVHFKPNITLFIPGIAVSLYTMLNTVLLGALSTSAQTGYYSYAEKLAKMPMAVITALGTVMLPHMSSAFASGKRKEGLALIKSSMWLMLAMAFALSFGIAGFAQEFVPIFLGPGFMPSVPVMVVLAWIIPLICATNVIGVQYLLPSHRDRQYTLSVCAGAVVNIGLCLALIPSLGAMGSAIGTVVAEGAVLVVQCWCVRGELPLGEYLKGCLPFVALGALMALVIRLVAVPLVALFGMTAMTLALEVLVGGTVFVVLALVFCLKTHNEQFDRLLGGYVRSFRENQLVRLKAIGAHETTVCLALPIWIVSEIATQSFASGLLPFQLISHIALGAMIFSELIFNKHNLRSLAVLAVLVVLVYPLNKAEQGVIARLALVAYCVRGLPMRKMVKVALVSTIVGASLVVILCASGVIADFQIMARGIVPTRHSLGFGYVTYLSHYFLNIALMYLYLRRGHLSVRDIVVLLLVNIGIYALTESRNSFILMNGVLLICVLHKVLRRPFPWKHMGPLLAYSFVVCGIVAFVILMLPDYTQGFGATLDRLLSQRVRLSQVTYDQYGLTVLGQKVKWIPYNLIHTGLYDMSQYLFVDSSYLNVLITAGVVPFVVFMVWLTAVTRTAYKKGDYVLSAVFLVFAIHSILDPQMLRLDYCGFLVFMGPVLLVLTGERESTSLVSTGVLVKGAVRWLPALVLSVVLGFIGGRYVAQHRVTTCHYAAARLRVAPQAWVDSTIVDGPTLLQSDELHERVDARLKDTKGVDWSAASGVMADPKEGQMVLLMVQGPSEEKAVQILDTLEAEARHTAIASRRFSVFFSPTGTLTTWSADQTDDKFILVGTLAGVALPFGVIALVERVRQRRERAKA